MKETILNKEKRMKSKFIVILTVIAVGLTFIVCPAFAADKNPTLSCSSWAMTSAS